nr:putative SWI/SNF-related matrix-associated actin-dependent regulator of chromatin subfamily A member 3-like 3 isoform X3 [Ipomoea trifida]
MASLRSCSQSMVPLNHARLCMIQVELAEGQVLLPSLLQRKPLELWSMSTLPKMEALEVVLSQALGQARPITDFLHENGSGEKSIVFSQWTLFLDLLEIPFRKSGIGFLRFDGKTQQKQREKVLHEYSETTEKMVLLMSLKAGGVDLNLTAASNETVEERMQQVQARKQKMIAGALTDDEVRSARIEELKMLFR